MRVQVQVALELTGQTLLPGAVIDIPDNLLERLNGKVVPVIVLANSGKDSHLYCRPSDSWCGARLPDSNYPDMCISIRCEYHQPGGTAK